MIDDLVPMNSYELEQYREVLKYMKEEPGIIQKGAGLLLKPVTWMVSKIIPHKAIEGALSAANGLAEWLTDEDDIKRDGEVDSIENLRTKDLALSDQLANNVHNWAIATATVEGGAAGAVGLPGMIVDIPTLITMSIRVIHKIGLCYGYKSKSESDKNFVLNIFSIAGANTMQEKVVSVITLRQIEVILLKTSWKEIAEKATEKGGIYATIIAIRNLAKQLGINITKRKAAQAIPVIGAGVGAAMNGDFLKDVGWAARRCFQERWLKDNHKVKWSDGVEDAVVIE